MELSTILVISGKPDISELVSQTKGGAIVMNLVTGQKFPVFRNDRISSLNEISIFVEDGDKPLAEVMQDIFRKQDGKQVEIDIKKASSDEVFAFFKEVEPSYDTDRVHASDVKKILSWYNLLVANEKIDLEEPKEESVEE